MKKILIIILSAMVFYSCEQFNSVAEFPEFVQWEDSGISLDENAAEPYAVIIQLVGKQKSSTVPIEFEVENENVVEGVDYIFPNGKTLSIDANSSTGSVEIQLIDNPDFSPDARTFTLTLVSAGELSTGSEDAPNKSYKVKIVEDDCPVPSLVGSYNVVTTDTSPGGCAGVENVVVITENGPNSYSMSDVTGGLYLNCYGAADNPGDISVDKFAISLVDQPDVVYGGDIFNGTGVIACDGSFTLTWSNGFGDAGTSTFTQ